MNETLKNTLSELEKNLDYQFIDQGILKTSLTHRSFVHKLKEPLECNERLEFLGDAILDLVISDLLMEEYPLKEEGELSKMRALIVNKGSLAQIAKIMMLDEYLILGRGEEITQGRKKNSILADAYEAILGAIYKDGGYQRVYQVVKKHFAGLLEEIRKEGLFFDYKTKLQEATQAKHKIAPRYQVIKESGPDHRKSFEVKVVLQKKILAFGKGRSKKEAEQSAAKAAIEVLEL